MTKNLTTINQFIDKSIGEWKSIRSTHTLAFQEYENTTSNILIDYLDIDNKKVSNLVNKFKFKFIPSYALTICWKSQSDWVDEKELNTDDTILVFSEKDERSGIILRNKGYAELVHSCSEYFFDNYENLNLKTEYNSTICNERIWFLSENLRSRYSVIKNKISDSVLQTSHSSEIRRIIT